MADPVFQAEVCNRLDGQLLKPSRYQTPPSRRRISTCGRLGLGRPTSSLPSKFHPVRFGFVDQGKGFELAGRRYPAEPMGAHGLQLPGGIAAVARAGVWRPESNFGERMHKARHTAGQRVLDKTGGNLKAVQRLLGHADISTTGNIYIDWDVDQLAETLGHLRVTTDRPAGTVPAARCRTALG